MRDRDDAVLRTGAHRRLEANDEVVARRTNDRAIGLGADCRRAQVGGCRGGGTRARSARIEIEAVRIACEPAARAPAVEWSEVSGSSPIRRDWLYRG